MLRNGVRADEPTPFLGTVDVCEWAQVALREKRQ